MIEDIPDDENGDVLRQMRLDGDDLAKARDIDFTVVFPGERQALGFAAQFRKAGNDVAAHRSDVVPELPWDVVVSRFMVPNHAAITSFETELQVAAEPHGGRNDGWGCFQREAADH